MTARINCSRGPLYSTLASDPEMAPLVEMFVDDLPERVQLLLDHLQASDRDGLRRVAHQLTGAAGSYGFHEITAEAATSGDDAVRRRARMRDRRGDQYADQSLPPRASSNRRSPPGLKGPKISARTHVEPCCDYFLAAMRECLQVGNRLGPQGVEHRAASREYVRDPVRLAVTLECRAPFAAADIDLDAGFLHAA